MEPFLDPRQGDFEDDASSTKSRPLWRLAGSLLVEISLPKFILTWLGLVGLPAVVLGIAPVVTTAWLSTMSAKLAAAAGLGSVAVIGLIAALGLWAGRSLLSTVERGFWSLNALAVQPVYTLCREGLRHVVEAALTNEADVERRSYLRSVMALGGGAIVSALSLGVVALLWPCTSWTGQAADLVTPHRLVLPALANGTVIVAGYVAVAALGWGVADATMDPLIDLRGFDPAPADARRWRIAHLSDTHVVAGRYGFRLESGRSGARGNDRFTRALDRLDAVHAADSVDLVLLTGDMTDAGTSEEWAEFLDIMDRYPRLKARLLILPGNHDLNVVDRANPARLDSPFGGRKHLRRARTLAAMAELQGGRVQVLGRDGGEAPAMTLDAYLAPHRETIAAFADRPSWRLARRIGSLWENAFPMLLPPAGGRPGVLLLNSNAETHFSFTNALGLVPADHVSAMQDVMRRHPEAAWIVALHHHLLEYPAKAGALSERVGTALVNGSWFTRCLQRDGARIVVMHGHRHVDWIGSCGPLRIVSAPSPVMDVSDDAESYFYIHTVAAGPRGLCLLEPEKVQAAAAFACAGTQGG